MGLEERDGGGGRFDRAAWVRAAGDGRLDDGDLRLDSSPRPLVFNRIGDPPGVCESPFGLPFAARNQEHASLAYDHLRPDVGNRHLL